MAVGAVRCETGPFLFTASYRRFTAPILDRRSNRAQVLRSEYPVVLPSGASMLSLLVAVTLAVQQPPPPPPQDTTKRDTTKVKLDSLPLKTTRTVSFETSEGTWISLDVSPGGKTIVFELMGDLYTMPVTGGAATRITSGPAFDSQPRWSPDGKRIVFLSDRSGAENVWLCDADGSHAKALTKGATNLYASPDWTPDGNYIVVSRTAGFLGSVYELWLIHKDGGSGAAMLRVQAGPNQPPPMNTQRHASSAVIRREVARVCYAPRRGDGAAPARPREWRREMAPLSRDP